MTRCLSGDWLITCPIKSQQRAWYISDGQYCLERKLNVSADPYSGLSNFPVFYYLVPSLHCPYDPNQYMLCWNYAQC